jgi:CDGSH-type Zn-finger protein
MRKSISHKTRKRRQERARKSRLKKLLSRTIILAEAVLLILIVFVLLGHEQQKAKTGKVIVTKDGPYVVMGGLPLAKEIIVHDDNEGCPTAWAPGQKYPDMGTYTLCRCGQSGHKPFCDGTHKKTAFDGTETASRQDYLERAETIGGKDIALLDVQNLCARARFCQQGRGIWQIAAS